MKMKLKNMMFSLPALAFVLTSTSGFGQNLLINGDFEVNLNTVTPSVVVVSVADFFDFAQSWDAGHTYAGWVSNNVADSAGDRDTLWHASNPSSSTWLANHERVPEFVNSSYSGGNFAGGLTLRPISDDSNLTYSQNCQLVTDLSGDYTFEGVFAVPSTSSVVGAEAVVSFNTYLSGALVSSGVVGTLYNQQVMEFSHTISQTVGAFDAIEVCYSVESLDLGSSMIAVDGFSLTAVPEPSSALLLGLGSLGLIARRRR